MSHSDEGGCVAAAIGAILCFILGCAAGCEHGTLEMRKDATKHNAAQYVIVDHATGRTEFKWNDELTTGGMTDGN